MGACCIIFQTFYLQFVHAQMVPTCYIALSMSHNHTCWQLRWFQFIFLIVGLLDLFITRLFHPSLWYPFWGIYIKSICFDFSTWSKIISFNFDNFHSLIKRGRVNGKSIEREHKMSERDNQGLLRSDESWGCNAQRGEPPDGNHRTIITARMTFPWIYTTAIKE